MASAYENIKRDVRNKILRKVWLPGIKMPSSREFSAHYNCSINTIEKSLRDLQAEGLLYREPRRGTFVSESVFTAGDEALESMTGTIAAVVDSVNSYIFAKALRGIEDVLKTKGYALTISSHDNELERQEHVLRELISKGVSGIILYPALAFENSEQYYERLETLLDRTNIVCMDRYIYNAGLSIPYVTSDNFYASYQLTRRLIQQGHKRIGFVRNYNISTVIERITGFEHALIDHGIRYRDQLDILLHTTNERIGDYPTDWIAEKIETLGLTAFFATDYNIAGHIMKGLAKLGLRIPDDVSLVSYEVEYLNALVPINITGVTQRFYEMGKTAAKIVLDMIHDSHKTDVTGFVCHSIMHDGESINSISG